MLFPPLLSTKILITTSSFASECDNDLAAIYQGKGSSSVTRGSGRGTEGTSAPGGVLREAEICVWGGAQNSDKKKEMGKQS